MNKEFKPYDQESIEHDMYKRKSINAELKQDGNIYKVKFLRIDGRVVMEHDMSVNISVTTPLEYRVINKNDTSGENMTKANKGFIVVWIGTYGSEHSVLNDTIYDTKKDAIDCISLDIKVNNHHCYNDKCMDDVIVDVEDILDKTDEIRIPSGDSYTIHEVTKMEQKGE